YHVAGDAPRTVARQRLAGLGPTAARTKGGKMRFWIREVMGWVLVLIGLFLFYTCIAWMTQPDPWIIEAFELSVVGVIGFWGGIQLRKVAGAARVCLQAQKPMETERAPAAAAARPGRAANRPTLARRG